MSSQHPNADSCGVSTNLQPSQREHLDDDRSKLVAPSRCPESGIIRAADGEYAASGSMPPRYGPLEVTEARGGWPASRISGTSGLARSDSSARARCRPAGRSWGLRWLRAGCGPARGGLDIAPQSDVIAPVADRNSRHIVVNGQRSLPTPRPAAFQRPAISRNIGRDSDLHPGIGL
jgi:hypothetical protein